jgi:hypothetical protein
VTLGIGQDDPQVRQGKAPYKYTYEWRLGELDGFTGTILKVDLTKEKVVKENPGESFYRKWLGAYGIGARVV